MIGVWWQPVTRHTRAPATGRIIRCECGEQVRVFHFSWTALVCPGCHWDIEKSQWTTEH